jgi:hypothetical protein
MILLLQRRLVRGEHRARPFRLLLSRTSFRIELLDRHDERGIRCDPNLAIDHLGELRHRAHAVAGARLRDRRIRALHLLLMDLLQLPFLLEVCHEPIGVELVVPRVEYT